MLKKTGDHLGFFNFRSVTNHQKNEGGPFGEKFRKKSLAMPKKPERRDPLVSPRIVCYAEKKEETFLVQFSRPNGSIQHRKIW